MKLYKILILIAVSTLSFLPTDSLKAQVVSIPQSGSLAPTDMVSLPAADTAPVEDYTDPRLPPYMVKQSTALRIERDDLPAYTRELWRVQWRKGDPIDLYIILPKQVAKPPVILYLYGFPADTDRFLDDTYCKTVTARGIAAVGFVSALTGQRYHDRRWKDWFVNDLPEALGASIHDVQMIINFVETRPNLDAHRIGMFGQGSGATIAALAAASDPRIRAVDLLDPWGDWNLWLKQSSLVPDNERAAVNTSRFLEDVAQLDPLSRFAHFAPERARLQQTSFDRNTPQNIQAILASAMPAGAEIIRYESVEDYEQEASSGGKILNWLSKKLMP